MGRLACSAVIAILAPLGYAVRGDPSLVVIEDNDDVKTFYRIAWPGLGPPAP